MGYPWNGRCHLFSPYYALGRKQIPLDSIYGFGCGNYTDYTDVDLQELHNHVTTQTAQAFVNSFLSRVIRAHSEHYLDDIEDVPALDLTRVLPLYLNSPLCLFDDR